jgi:hypothetical protein
MSMDYPDNLRIREKSHLLGCVWMIGDLGYYLGLIGAVLAVAAAFAAALVGGLGHLIAPADERALRWWRLWPTFLGTSPFLVAIFVVSRYLKWWACKRSGIHQENV